jgi:citrate synthase
MTTEATSAAVNESVEIEIQGKRAKLPFVRGSEGERALDITALRNTLGVITLDPGYANTGACRSAVAFIDGERGILRYRGYPIDEIAEKSTYLEVAWLLIHGELPTSKELAEFTNQITRHTMLHQDFGRFFGALPKDAHPMPVCVAAIGALATFYQEPETDQHIQETIIRLIAKMPTIAAYSYKHSIGQPALHPKNDLDYTSNFLRMMFGTPCEEYSADPVVAKAIDLLLILHADHEQNCSTSTVRLVGSSMANLFASQEGSAEKFLNRAKDHDDTARLMGFGHRVYKSYDPRAAILKRTCAEVIDRVGASSRLLEIAMRLEELALKDDYFVSRKLYPNVDFYSGVIYKVIGIPVNMYTLMFAMGRLSGWIAQWLEMRRDPSFRIGRPRQIYSGPTERRYRPIRSRG